MDDLSMKHGDSTGKIPSIPRGGKRFDSKGVHKHGTGIDLKTHEMYISMAVTQDPIDWRYLPYIRPYIYGTNVPPF